MPHDADLSQQGDFRDRYQSEYAASEAATLSELARGLNATVRLVQALHHEVKDFAINHATLRITISSMEETMKELRRAITASDPASLTIRLIVLEQELSAYKQWKKEQDDRVKEAEQERDRRDWHVKAAIGAAGLSLAGNVIMGLLKFVANH